MAVDMFLKIADIGGESQDAKHLGQIDILAWSWGMSQSGTMHAGSGGGTGKVNVQDMSFTHWFDKSSPMFMLYCSNGKHIPRATLIVRKAGEKPLEYIKITMKKVIVTSVSTGGSGGEDRLTENVALNFAEVKVEYQMQDAKGGGKAGPEYNWNIATNTAS